MAIDTNTTVSSQTHKMMENSESTVSRKQSAVRESGHSSMTDTVTLSNTARLIDSLKISDHTIPVFDSQKVSDIRNLIDTGSYEINTFSIAEKLQNFTISRGPGE